MDWNRSTNNFIRSKVQAVLDVQTQLAPVWMWTQKSLPQWQADLAELDRLIPEDVTKRMLWYAASEASRHDLGLMQSCTSQFKREGERRFRQQPEIRSQLSNLNTRVQKPERIHEVALQLRALWEKADPGWDIDKRLTLTNLIVVLQAFPERENAKQATWKAWYPVTSALQSKIYAARVDTEAWYAAATERFPAGTTEGDLIRSAVPTAMPKPQEVGSTTISNLKVTEKGIEFDCAAPGATHYTYLHQPPGSPFFLVVAADIPETHMTLPAPAPGVHRVRAAGNNAMMEGHMCAVQEVTVPGAAVAAPETNVTRAVAPANGTAPAPAQPGP